MQSSVLDYKDAEVDGQQGVVNARRVIVQILASVCISKSLYLLKIRKSEESLRLGFDGSVTNFNV